jgi:PilZ domain
MEAAMASLSYSRIYHRFLLSCPVIFGGAPFVGEGVLTNLSLTGCSVTCDREVLCGSAVRVSVLLPNQPRALSIDLGTIKWVQGHQFGVEFLRLPVEARQRLNSTLRIELIGFLKARSGRREAAGIAHE